MDMFNVKRRDNPSMDRYMDLKKPEFGGPKEKQDFAGSKRKTLAGYQRMIDRDPNFEGGAFNHNYDTTWKAITRDRISRDAKKKPFDPMYARNTYFSVDIEEGKIDRFEEFVNENYEFEAKADNPDEIPMDDDSAEIGYEVDQEQLDQLIEEFGKDITKLLDKVAEKMEMEKTEICDLMCAAVEKMCNEPAEGEEEPKEEIIEEDDDNMFSSNPFEKP